MLLSLHSDIHQVNKKRISVKFTCEVSVQDLINESLIQ